MIAEFRSVAIPRLGLGLNASDIVAAGVRAHHWAGINRRATLLSGATKQSIMSAGLVPPERPIVLLWDESFPFRLP